MKSLCAALTLTGLLAAPGAGAQTAGTGFEVASIKPSRPDAPRGGFGIMPGGRFQAEGVTLADLATIAYSEGVPIRRFQVTGGPGWMDTDRFDIVAKTGSDAPPAGPQMAAMIRSLLVERFKIVARKETKDAPIYVLGLARDGQLGPKLKRSSLRCPAPGEGPPPPSEAEALRQQCVYRVGYGVLTGRGVTLSQLAYSIANFYGIGRLVVDRTGLAGGYDMDMEWAPLTQFRQPGNLDPPADAADRPVNAGPTIFVALRDQLGLSLEPSRGPVPTVVIERAEKPTLD